MFNDEMKDIKLFVVCHIYALIWGFTHIILFLGLTLCWYHRWDWLAVYAVSISALARVEFPKNRAVAEFFIPSLMQLCGGVKFIGNRSTSSRPRLYAVHPHAILANGFGFAIRDCVARGERVSVAATSWICWLNPLFRWFVNSVGCKLISVTKHDLDESMRRGENIAILPGGFEEVMLMEKERDVMFIRKRQGFVAFARKYQYEIVPVVLFGESQLYENALKLPRCIRGISARLRIPLVFPTGKSSWNLLPNIPRAGLLIVFGRGIPAELDRDVSDIREEYIQAVVSLYEKHNPYASYRLSILSWNLKVRIVGVTKRVMCLIAIIWQFLWSNTFSSSDQ